MGEGDDRAGRSSVGGVVQRALGRRVKHVVKTYQGDLLFTHCVTNAIEDRKN